jgi:hypothetical protein
MSFTNFESFKIADRRLRKAMGKISGLYVNHTLKSIDFFMGNGSHNVQILNDLLDTATMGKLPRNRIIDWLAPVIPHIVKKGQGGIFTFGAKEEGRDYDPSLAIEHFQKFPSWEIFKKEQAPDSFDPLTAIQKEIKRIKKLASDLEKGGYSIAGATFGQWADSLEIAPLLTKDAEEEEEVTP